MGLPCDVKSWNKATAGETRTVYRYLETLKQAEVKVPTNLHRLQKFVGMCQHADQFQLAGHGYLLGRCPLNSTANRMEGANSTIG